MMLEAQEIFGLDFDPAELDQLGEGLVSDEEQDGEVCSTGLPPSSTTIGTSTSVSIREVASFQGWICTIEFALKWS